MCCSSAGADVNDTGENGGTVLMTAALFNRNPEVIEYLLDAGAEPGREDVHGNTAWDYVQMNRAAGRHGGLRHPEGSPEE
ncbi:ankyrin repeat domain-containing protein [Halomonas sp.]|uniref:ankyrin repeat domain-containing protein n=1 Tax=Halomonas sp. TaxID=1486246 RepID=UPI003A0FD3BB